MAFASLPRNSLNDENYLPVGKSGVQGTGLRPASGLKQQQSATSERKILSDISNSKAKPSTRPGLSIRPDVRLSKPDSIFKSENLTQPSQKQPSSAPRVPLRPIVNESKASSRDSLGQRPKATELKKKTLPRVRLTAEQVRQAEEWAKEDLPIEQTHFTGEDMDALREKIMQEEIEETVARVRNYQGFRAPAVLKPTLDENLYFDDGRLKPDPREESLFDFSVHIDEFELAAGRRVETDSMVAAGITEETPEIYPPVPDNWHIVRDP